MVPVEKKGVGLAIALIGLLVILPDRALPFQSGTFDLTPEKLALDSGGRLPPDGWKPSFDERRIGERLPFDWDERYRKQYGQEFQPVVFYNNAIALCSYSTNVSSEGSDALFDEIFHHMMKFTDADKDGIWIRNNFDFAPHDKTISAPWHGAIMNGFVLTGMALALDCFDKPEYRGAMKGIANAFKVFNRQGKPPPQRWISHVDENGYLWFDEYPMDEGRPTLVLNGNIFALFALAVYSQKVGDASVLPLVRGNLKTLKDNVSRFRSPGTINLYDLYNADYADYSPARTVRQQCQLYSLTGDDVFRGMAHVFAQDSTDAGETVKSMLRYCR